MKGKTTKNMYKEFVLESTTHLVMAFCLVAVAFLYASYRVVLAYEPAAGSTEVSSVTGSLAGIGSQFSDEIAASISNYNAEQAQDKADKDQLGPTLGKDQEYDLDVLGDLTDAALGDLSSPGESEADGKGAGEVGDAGSDGKGGDPAGNDQATDTIGGSADTTGASDDTASDTAGDASSGSDGKGGSDTADTTSSDTSSSSDGTAAGGDGTTGDASSGDAGGDSGSAGSSGDAGSDGSSGDGGDSGGGDGGGGDGE